jgi:hypothetical protein
MIDNTRFGMFRIDNISMLLPENSRYNLFENPSKGKSIHVIFYVSGSEYRFTIASVKEQQKPQVLAEQAYLVNLIDSVPTWCIPPKRLEGARTEAWACGYGIKNGEGLRIYKIFFEGSESLVCLTFSAHPDSYNAGIEVFQEIARSFMVFTKIRPENLLSGRT